ncbi:lipopolysaccharide biosynthesis protein [Rhizorhabdus dicambivorans]|nr:oligosaccharide flippase family protein [Rhizorhabdus dicambivorans]
MLATASTAILFSFWGRDALVKVVAHARPSRVEAMLVLHSIRRYAWAYILFALLGWVMTLFDRYLLAAYLDAAAVGQYAAVAAIASRLVLMPSGMLSSVLRPVLYDAATVGDLAKWRKLVRIWLTTVILLGVGALGFVWLFADFIAGILLAAEYRHGARVVMALVGLSYSFLALAQMFEMAYLSHGVPAKMLFSRFLGAGLMLSVALFLVPAHGIVGASIASVAGHVGLASGALWLLLRALPSKGVGEAGGV